MPASRSTSCPSRTSRRTARPTPTPAPTCRSRSRRRSSSRSVRCSRRPARARRSSGTTTTGRPTPNDAANTPPGEDPATDYPYRLLSGPAAKWIAGTAYHCYYGDPSDQTALHDAFPKKGIWFTECSGSHGPTDTPEQIFRGTLTWHARTIAIGTTRNWAQSVVNWNIALREDGTPHLGGCGTCTGLLTIADDGTVRTDAEYYTIGHLAKFVRPAPSASRPPASAPRAGTGRSWTSRSATPTAPPPSSCTTRTTTPRSFAVAVGDRSFEYTLPGGALATFTWPASRALRDVPRQLDLSGATATATLASADAGLAVDGDASTRWSSGTAQVPGQSLTVDLGRPTLFRQVAIDSGDNLGDFARSYAVEVSLDGRRWRTVAEGQATGQLTTVQVRPTLARHLRITSTGTAGSWWSIADVRLYRWPPAGGWRARDPVRATPSSGGALQQDAVLGCEVLAGPVAVARVRRVPLPGPETPLMADVSHARLYVDAAIAFVMMPRAVVFTFDRSSPAEW